MFYQPILLPMLAMVALTFAVWVAMYVTRLREIFARGIDAESLGNTHEARSMLTDSSGPSDNFRNLFEMPVLFYLALLLSLLLLIQDPLLVMLAWTYVALRAAHSLIHCTYNRVTHRFTVYLASCAVLFMIWLRLAWYIAAF
jgi:hypothetical protein